MLFLPANIISYSCRWETCTATARVPDDTGTVAVVDGCRPILSLCAARPCDFHHSFYPSHALQDAKRPASHVFSQAHPPALAVGTTPNLANSLLRHIFANRRHTSRLVGNRVRRAVEPTHEA
jgi:hypothetical protein